MAAPGLELMFNSIKNAINTPKDSIVSVLHWQIIADGYKCIGLGEKNGNNEEESEMLPDGWNVTPDLYVMRYKHATTGKTYVFKVIAVDNTLLVHFWKMSDENVARCNIQVADFATQDFSSFKKAIKKIDELCSTFNREVLTEVKPDVKPGVQPGSSRQGQRSRLEEDDDPLRVPTRHQRPRPNPYPDWGDGPDDPFSVGRGDLDPVGAGGGGMLFDPMRGGRGPRFGMDPSAGLPSRLPPAHGRQLGNEVRTIGNEMQPSGTILYFGNVADGTSLKQIKDFVKDYAPYQWLEFKRGDTEAFVRYYKENQAKEVLEKALAAMNNEIMLNGNKLEARVLEGEEEVVKWLSMEKEKKENLKKQRKRKSFQKNRWARKGKREREERRRKLHEDGANYTESEENGKGDSQQDIKDEPPEKKIKLEVKQGPAV